MTLVAHTYTARHVWQAADCSAHVDTAQQTISLCISDLGLSGLFIVSYSYNKQQTNTGLLILHASFVIMGLGPKK